MKENVEQLKATINELIIETQLQQTEIKNLTYLVFELMHRMEQKDGEAIQMKIDYARTLQTEKSDRLTQCEKLVPKSRIVREKLKIEQHYSDLIYLLKNS